MQTSSTRNNSEDISDSKKQIFLSLDTFLIYQSLFNLLLLVIYQIFYGTMAGSDLLLNSSFIILTVLFLIFRIVFCFYFGWNWRKLNFNNNPFGKQFLKGILYYFIYLIVISSVLMTINNDFANFLIFPVEQMTIIGFDIFEIFPFLNGLIVIPVGPFILLTSVDGFYATFWFVDIIVPNTEAAFLLFIAVLFMTLLYLPILPFLFFFIGSSLSKKNIERKLPYV